MSHSGLRRPYRDVVYHLRCFHFILFCILLNNIELCFHVIDKCIPNAAKVDCQMHPKSKCCILFIFVLDGTTVLRGMESCPDCHCCFRRSWLLLIPLLLTDLEFTFSPCEDKIINTLLLQRGALQITRGATPRIRNLLIVMSNSWWCTLCHLKSLRQAQVAVRYSTFPSLEHRSKKCRFSLLLWRNLLTCALWDHNPIPTYVQYGPILSFARSPPWESNCPTFWHQQQGLFLAFELSMTTKFAVGRSTIASSIPNLPLGLRRLPIALRVLNTPMP